MYKVSFKNKESVMSSSVQAQTPMVVVNNEKNKCESHTFSNGRKLVYGTTLGGAVGLGAGLLAADTLDLSETKKAVKKKGWFGAGSNDWTKFKKYLGEKWTKVCDNSSLAGKTNAWWNRGLSRKTKVGIKAGAGTAAGVVALMTLYNFLFGKKDV